MRRWLALGVLLLGLLTAGFFWSQDRPSALAMQAPAGAGAPTGEHDEDDSGTPPASDVTPAQREARRLARIDADDDGAVSRAEFLASRRKSFGKLDGNGNGSLDFEEYAAATAKRFGKAEIILLSWKPEASIFKPWTWVLDARPSRFFKILK